MHSCTHHNHTITQSHTHAITQSRRLMVGETENDDELTYSNLGAQSTTVGGTTAGQGMGAKGLDLKSLTKKEGKCLIVIGPDGQTILHK